MARHRRRNRRERMLRRRRIFIWMVFIGSILFLGYASYRFIKSNFFYEAPVESTSPETVKPTEKTDPYDVDAAKKQYIQRVIEESKKYAASYDYEKAISTLEEDQYYRETLEMLELVETYKKEKANLVEWKKIDNVTVLMLDTLVVDPERAFYGNAHSSEYNRNHITVDEFKKILEYLYANDYVLVKMTDLCSYKEEETTENGITTVKINRTKHSLYLPEGKTPIILTQDNVNYYSSMQGNGFASRLIINDAGNVVAEYKYPDGSSITGAYDLIPIVDEFVEKHPDFSYKGAKGVLGLTGYEGAFGYRIQKDSDDLANMKQTVSDISKILIAGGWEFACRGYNNTHVKSISLEEFMNDLNAWQTLFVPLIGNTQIYFWPFGEDSDGGIEIGTWRKYEGAKYEYLKSLGFHYYCNIDVTNKYWVQLTGEYLRMGRIDITGFRMYDDINNNRDRLSFLFDVLTVFDKEHRPSMK